jgi:hypothetical protein
MIESDAGCRGCNPVPIELKKGLLQCCIDLKCTTGDERQLADPRVSSAPESRVTAAVRLVAFRLIRKRQHKSLLNTGVVVDAIGEDHASIVGGRR